MTYEMLQNAYAAPSYFILGQKYRLVAVATFKWENSLTQVFCGVGIN